MIVPGTSFRIAKMRSAISSAPIYLDDSDVDLAMCHGNIFEHADEDSYTTELMALYFSHVRAAEQNAAIVKARAMIAAGESLASFLAWLEERAESFRLGRPVP